MAVTADSEKEKNLFPPVDRFKMAAPTRLYESIIADISDRISRGVLKPGDILPSERELAEQFQLSRIPVREALKILEFLGVISYVPGKGMYVQPLEVPALVSKIFFGLNTSSDNIRQLFEVRLLLETYAARYGAERRTEEDLEELRGAVEHMPGEEGAQIEESLRFHMGVIKTAHNDIITEFYKFLSTLLTEGTDAYGKAVRQPAALLPYGDFPCDRGKGQPARRRPHARPSADGDGVSGPGGCPDISARRRIQLRRRRLWRSPRGSATEREINTIKRYTNMTNKS